MEPATSNVLGPAEASNSPAKGVLVAMCEPRSVELACQSEEIRQEYLLFAQSESRHGPPRWRFVLRAPDGRQVLEASDEEPDVRGERIALLSVVRGLEAISQPSRVTLITSSRHIREGIRFGLPQWRKHDWRWEFFGHMVPIANADLWRRIDRAMQIHDVQCRNWRIDAAHRSPYRAHALGGRSSATKRWQAAWSRLAAFLAQYGGRLKAHPSPFRRWWTSRMPKWAVLSLSN